VKRLTAGFLVLLSALAAASCNTPPKETPPPTGPGCYDARGRLEPMVRSAGECAVNNWTWVK
jgi:hypothetical protein